MVYRAPAPVIKPHKNQLLHMFHLRGLFGSSKDLCFAVVLFSSIFILATCTRCTTVKEVQNRVEFRGSSYSSDVIQNVCNPSNSFCFPLTLSRFEDDKSGPELEALGASEVYSEGFSSELSQLPYHGNFRFLGGGRNISCSFYQEDGFPEFSSSSLSPLFEKKTHNSSLLVAPTESPELSFTDGLSPPPVEINPSLLDYGNKNMYYPSLAYLTVKNLDSDSFLSVYEPYSDNSQFYPCGFSATLLAPGENASLCFVFFPTHLGFSSAKLIIQTSFGGFLIQARGFSIESPYLLNPLSGFEVKMDCKIIVQVNDTKFPEMEIPCMDVISVFSGGQLDSSGGYGAQINVDYINGGDRFFSMKPPSGIKALNAPESDELILQSWKSQAKVSMMSPLDMDELLFPIILIGNYSSQWISVKTPSPKPVAMQLILNSGQAINNCQTPETLLQPSSSNTLLGNSNSIAPTSYGFSLPKDAITEALIHPYSSATLGPILFQPSNRCDWRSSVLIRNNLSGVEWLLLRASGGSLSLVLHQGYEYDPVQILEFKMNLPTRLNFSSSENLLHSTGVQRAFYCSESLTKIVYAKNTGDLPLEVTRVKVSGAECGLDGFIINNCTGFTILPGESVRLCISYKTDFNAATVHRELELVSTAGIVVLPMKASIPVHRLNFCRRSVFWTRLKKATAVLLFAASLVYFIISFLFSHVTTASASLDFMSGEKKSYSSGLIGTVGSKIVQDEALLLDQFAVSTSPSSVLKVDMQDTFDSRDVKVIDGKGKGRRRRKKRSSGVGVLLFEASGSQSGNSTPSSPLSPSRCTTTPKVVETRNPFSRASLEQSDACKCTKALLSEVPLKREKGNRAHSDNRVQHSSRANRSPCFCTFHVVSERQWFPPSLYLPLLFFFIGPEFCYCSSFAGPRDEAWKQRMWWG